MDDGKNSSIFFQKLLKFGGQFDLDGQGLGHQFLNSPKTCHDVDDQNRVQVEG